MQVGQILNENLIDLELNAKSKDEAIRKLTKLLSDEGCISDVERFIKDVYRREAEGQTGIGNQIAIPHGKSAAVNATSIAIGRTTSDLDWESTDAKPIRVVILFAVRNVNKTTVHLKLMSQVAVALADLDEALEKLRAAMEKKEVIGLLSRHVE